jgi:valyl-tRNA synthetase
VYRKNEPALYCPTCRTTIAQAELDSVEQASSFNDIVFTAADGARLVIGTTRPELLPSCVALLYHPDDARYTHLASTQVTVPLFGFTVPVIADEMVIPEKGTGLVMCCTFGDKTDIEWFKKYNLPYKPSLGRDGKFLPDTGVCAGLKPQEARKKVLEELSHQGLLVNQKAITHAVGVHERCKKEIEFIVIPQWFIALLPYKQTLIELADQIQWYPAFMKSRYVNWVENLGWDWCISRQRFFGIPFPAWHCNNCGTILFPDESKLPLDPQEVQYGAPCSTCGSTDIRPDTDVMDTWNTSSITPYICRQLAQQSNDNPFAQESVDWIPMSMRPQAHDIIRTWAFYTIAKVWMHHKTIAWDSIVISGHVLASSKEKISKSQGNATQSPEFLLQNYAADVIRYWTASGNLGHDIAFSDQQLKIGNRLSTKLWNAFVFVATHIKEADIAATPESVGLLNEWLLDHASSTFERYQAALEKNEFGSALNEIEQFFWNHFCDNYLELVKDQLFKPEFYTPQEVAATRATLYQVGLSLLQWYAPYMPYVTEKLYQEIYRTKHGAVSLHQTQYADVQKKYRYEKSAAAGSILVELVAAVRKLKSENKVTLKLPLETLTVVCSLGQALSLRENERLIQGVTHAQQIVYADEYKGESTLREDASLWHAVVVL